MSVRDDITASMEIMSYAELAEHFKLLKDKIATHKKALSGLEYQYDILTKEIIPDRMAADGFRTLSLAEGGRIELRAQAYCSTKAGMKGNLFQWLHENGFEELVTEVVNPSTLKAFIKEQTEAGNPVPSEEIINYQPYTRATVVGK